jgi:hypothetical protein
MTSTLPWRNMVAFRPAPHTINLSDLIERQDEMLQKESMFRVTSMSVNLANNIRSDSTEAYLHAVFLVAGAAGACSS